MYSRIRSCVGLIAGEDALEKRNIIACDKNRTYIHLRDYNIVMILKRVSVISFIFIGSIVCHKSGLYSSLNCISHNSGDAESIFMKFAVGKIYYSL
jgi:hypothetical protein